MNNSMGTGQTSARNAGFSFVEMVVSVLLTTLLLLALYQFYIEAAFQMHAGFAKLEALDEARLAISYIRRDFSTACPFLSAERDTIGNDPENEFAAKNLLRRMVFYQDVSSVQPPEIRPQMGADGKQSRPIEYSSAQPGQIRFYRFRFKPRTLGENPGVESVEYYFDKGAKTLTRRVSGSTKEFHDMDLVEFSFYSPEWSSDIVMLRIQIRVKNLPENLRQKIPGGVIVFQTTVNSHFISSNLSDPNWNFEGYQNKM